MQQIEIPVVFTEVGGTLKITREVKTQQYIEARVVAKDGDYVLVYTDTHGYEVVFHNGNPVATAESPDFGLKLYLSVSKRLFSQLDRKIQELTKTEAVPLGD